MKNKHIIKKFLPYYSKYRRIMVLDLLCASVTTVCELLLPMITRLITGTATDEPQNLTLKLILTVGIGYMVLRIIDTLANYYMAYQGHVMGTKMETDMRSDLFRHLEKLSFSYYQNTKIGTLMSRITSDLFDVTEFSHHCPEEFFIVGIKVIVSFVILMFINVPLTLIVFAILPVMVVCSMHFRRPMRKSFKERRSQIGEINACVEDSLLGIRVVKSFANEDIEIEKFKRDNDKFYKLKKESYKYMALFHCTTRFFDGLLYIVVVVAGGIFMGRGMIKPEDFVAYILYVSTLLASVKVIINFMEQFENGLTGIEKFVEIMETEPDIVDKENAVDPGKLCGNIRFDNVTFRYSEENEYVLKDINIDIKAGQSVALVGPSGGGKTTICNLIPRFYEVEKGTVSIDGINVNDMQMKMLRKNIGIVQQDVYLFSGTVIENIFYGRPGATREEAEEAAKMAGAHEFIMSLPNGYDTYVGERGVKLSGGQKQRISIARVFLKNPPILILDEATSSLDNESERIVQDSLSRLSKGRTVLTIAHRLTTIKNSDMILVLTENGIEERGNHKELIEKKGLYYSLYNI
ncbi:MAG: ABC transporter ATP-binding protein [Clostridia bacterium]|nr:ABC transporter ATP-binding protein [Clostridia bacterium]